MLSTALLQKFRFCRMKEFAVWLSTRYAKLLSLKHKILWSVRDQISESDRI